MKIGKERQKVILDVPYYSQHFDVEDSFWKRRACGVVCLKMVMDSYNRYSPPLSALISGTDARGGFGPSGWIHDYLVKVAQDYGFSAFRKEYNSFSEAIEDKVSSLAAGRPVIVSAVKNFSERDKFHLVVLVGFEAGPEGLIGFYYHDPDSPDDKEGRAKFVSLEKFRKYWRKMSIFIHPPAFSEARNMLK